MTLEELFVKEYEQQKQDYIELEKNKKLVEIELQEKQRLLLKVTNFLKEGMPNISTNGYLHMSYFLSGKAKDEAIELLKSLGIQIKEEQDE